MLTFNRLKRSAKAFADGPLKLAVTGDCATQLLVIGLKGALAEKGLSGQVFEADYDQVARQLLSPDSELRRFEPSIVVVWETVERWWMGDLSVQARLDSVASYANASTHKIFYLNAAPFRDGVFGNFAACDSSMSVKIRSFNAGLDLLAKQIPNLNVIDLNGLVADIGRASAYDAPTYMLSDMPLSPDALAELAKLIADMIGASQGQVRKCAVVDLDNTLWGGVIGEDGLPGIVLGEHGVGKAFSRFQRMLKLLKSRGVLIAVCSKNDESVAKDPFENHPDMILRLDDIACFVANWENKADNIMSIQKTLNIGFDSMVFLDDNPVEREIVRTECPQVAVPDLPEDPSLWVDFLARENLFETFSYSPEDADRTRQYQINVKRRAFEATFADEKTFLKNLQMVATCSPLDEFTIPRAAQLTQRSNQFNLRTVRYSADDLLAFAKDPSVLQLGITLSDRFGSHGLVSVLIAKTTGEEAFVDTWLMSCRVLKRGLEYYALNKMAELLSLKGVVRLVGEYIPTAKNGLVTHLYEQLGFDSLGSGRYELKLSNYAKRDTTING